MGASAQFTYTHDAAGRLTRYDVNRPDLEWQPSEAYGRDYGAANALNQVSSAGGQGLSFDLNGNLTAHAGTGYSWTFGNRLSGVSRPGSTATYAYDGEDRRTTKISNGVMTRTLWSGADEVADYDASGALLRRYIPDGTGAMDARLAVLEADGTIYWLHVDHQGSVIATSNAAGQALQFVNYSPYGEFGADANGNALTAPPVGSPFGYTGRTWDPESGLWQYRARYYHPGLGQFLSVDPIGTKDDPNLYMYVGLDPLNATDPSGESRLLRLGFNIVRRTLQARGNVVRAIREEGVSIASDVTALVGPDSSLPERAEAGVNLVSPIRVDEARNAVRSLRRGGPAATRNPNGRAGSPHHQGHVEDLSRDIESRGLLAEREVRIPTPDGARQSRYVDVAGRDPETREVVELHQVGRANADGTPVSRERQALDDIEASTGHRPNFRHYND